MRSLLFLTVVAALDVRAAEPTQHLSVSLPPSSEYREVVLSSSWFAHSAMLGPVGGPTHGFDVALALWPKGPTLVVAANIGKDALARDLLFVAVGKRALALRVEPDGHAASYSFDGGKSWRGFWVDGAKPFFCPHTKVSPGSLRPTLEQAREVLRDPMHVALVLGDPNRGDLMVDAHQEVRGALARVLIDSADDAAVSVALDWLASPAHAADIIEARLLDPELAPRLATFFAKNPGRRAALSALERAETREFFSALAKGPPAPAVTPPAQPVAVAPAVCASAPLPSPAVPSTLSAAAIFDRLVFPPAATTETCQATKSFAKWLGEQTTLSTLRGHPPSPPEPAPDPKDKRAVTAARMKAMLRTSCAPGVTTLVVGRWPNSYASLRTRKQEAFEEQFFRCGTSTKPDRACERALRERIEREYLTEAAAERQGWCRGWNDLVASARTCLDSIDGQPMDAQSDAERAQVWAIVTALGKMAEEVTCPAPPLSLIEPGR